MAERPAVYFHFEMGVSWPARQHAGPRTRRVMYLSKGAREDAGQFPRQLPPSNTAYLPGPSTQHQTYPYQHGLQPFPAAVHDASAWFPSGAHCHHPYIQQHQPQQPQPQPPNHFQASQYHERSPRCRNRSSYGRGRSAPPPSSENPWDVEAEPMAAAALPTRAPRPQLSKALPPTPGQFRLGHGDMPWSPSPFPMDPSEESENGSAASPGARPPHAHTRKRTQPHGADDRERIRTTEIQSLATAMMTVDNGFEDQWWYQGPRLVNIAGDLVTPATLAERYAPEGSGSWPATNIDTPSRSPWERHSLGSPGHSAVDIVSPISDLSSQDPTYHQPLKRSLTTRSDGLFM